MKISKITKNIQAQLNAIERRNLHVFVEYPHILNKTGAVTSSKIGTAANCKGINIPHDSFVLTHNHTGGKSRSLSPSDIKTGIRGNLKEVRGTSTDEYIMLVEIPSLTEQQRKKCLSITKRYYDKYENPKNDMFPDENREHWSIEIYRRMRKELKKAGKLKFRTLPMPSEMPIEASAGKKHKLIVSV